MFSSADISTFYREFSYFTSFVCHENQIILSAGKNCTRKSADIYRSSDIGLTLSPPIPSKLYTLPYWSNAPFLIFDIQALWRSGLSARAPERQKLKMVGYTSMALCPSNSSNLEQLALKGLSKLSPRDPMNIYWTLFFSSEIDVSQLLLSRITGMNNVVGISGFRNSEFRDCNPPLRITLSYRAFVIKILFKSNLRNTG